MQSSLLLHTSLVRPTCFHSTQTRSPSARRGTQQICCAHGQNRRTLSGCLRVLAVGRKRLICQRFNLKRQPVDRVCASNKVCLSDVGDATNLSLVAASCAAALLLQSSPASAKVIFEPVQSKKVLASLAGLLAARPFKWGIVCSRISTQLTIGHTPMPNIQVFQSAAEKVQKAASDAQDAAPSLPSAPSFSLPKFNAPSINPTIFSESGDIDPRAVALPG